MEKDTTITEISDARFVLDSEEKVNWLLRKLANLDAEKRRITAQYQTLLCALESEEKSLRWRFEGDLRAFAALKLESSGGRRKSVHLLQGTLCFRTVAQSLKVADMGAAVNYVKVTGLPLLETLTVEKLDTNGYREQAEARLVETGELLPGMELLPERETFAIRFGKGEE